MPNGNAEVALGQVWVGASGSSQQDSRRRLLVIPSEVEGDLLAAIHIVFVKLPLADDADVGFYASASQRIVIRLPASEFVDFYSAFRAGTNVKFFWRAADGDRSSPLSSFSFVSMPEDVENIEPDGFDDDLLAWFE